MQVVWFKRDLRVTDHAPLARAAKAGPCLCLYVYEPELLESDEFDASHVQFINESLKELDTELRKRGTHLVIRHGPMLDVLNALHSMHSIEAIWSHEETGNRITYDRDLGVARWAKTNGVIWTEIPQSGVVRRLRDRDGWSKRRNAFMSQPLAPTPPSIPPCGIVESTGIMDPLALGFGTNAKSELQIGGMSQGKELLKSFLRSRGERYSSEMSSPITADKSCSRLSPYLAWGCISMRSVVHALQAQQRAMRDRKKAGRPTSTWLSSLKSFESRLSWHCHFMQKLEDEPEIEFQNMNRAYDGLREDSFDQSRFDAWANGQTGYPMVDACMRALHQHSWINFRMRAMLVSFASYHLWLHWRPTAVYLARHFLDFEPGIHFSQFQMQSGTTGINSIRIYSPIKQVADQDPTGEFIRRFVPELEGVPAEHIAEPHKLSLSEQSRFGCRIGKDYPRPMVEHSKAYRSAREKIYAVRRTDAAKSEAGGVLRKHGSRKGPTSRRW